MFEKVDLLTKDNLIRHIQNKILKLSEISTLVQKKENPLILKSFLPLILAYFEASIIDTIKEYMLARPYEIFTLDVIKKLLSDMRLKQSKLNFEEKNFKEYILEEYLLQIENKCLKDKLRQLRKLLQIEIDLGGRDWEQINEFIARRNCLIHNDLIANDAYFRQAGSLKQKQLQVDESYFLNIISVLNEFLAKIKKSLEEKYSSNSNVSAIKRLWEYLFKDQYLLDFNSCWVYKNNHVRYIGSKIDDLKDCHSPRTIALFSAWMSFFGYQCGGDLRYFNTLFYAGEEDRRFYLKKLVFLMECFEKIDFQSFKVAIYDKP